MLKDDTLRHVIGSFWTQQAGRPTLSSYVRPHFSVLWQPECSY
jgi:hypothetical protein